MRGTKHKIFQNLLKQNFHCTEPNLIWCTDFTYIRMGNGKMCYNCSIIDLYDRSVVATLNSDYINTELVQRILNNCHIDLLNCPSASLSSISVATATSHSSALHTEQLFYVNIA
ncbi:MAG: hypothetical protein UDA86_06035, partial [Blautia sp.]|nr:hypothetical protein [Blautia sp.]